MLYSFSDRPPSSSDRHNPLPLFLNGTPVRTEPLAPLPLSPSIRHRQSIVRFPRTTQDQHFCQDMLLLTSGTRKSFLEQVRAHCFAHTLFPMQKQSQLQQTARRWTASWPVKQVEQTDFSTGGLLSQPS